jgi:hypothetical protein
VGTVTGQWVGATKDRRAARAEALKALAEVENARWAGTPEAAHPTFRRVLRDLQTAALVARLPRPIVDTYLVLATAGHSLSQQDAEVTPDPEYAGGIDAHLDDLIQDAARLVTDVAWSNGGLRWFRRVHMRHKRLLARIDQLSPKSQQEIEEARSSTT